MTLHFFIVALGLAAASEGSFLDESAWQERFQQIDDLRVLHGIPRLSPRERINRMLGHSPLDYFYSVTVEQNVHNGLQYDTVLWKWKRDFRHKEANRKEWVAVAVEQLDNDFLEDYNLEIGEQTADLMRMEKSARERARSLYIRYGSPWIWGQEP